MKALTLWQPWASLVACGAKRIETRTWETAYRGPLLIHAAARPAEDWQLHDPFADYVQAVQDALGAATTPADLPRGCIVAVAHLTAIVPTEDVRPGPARAFHPGDARVRPTLWIPYRERLFGDYSANRYAWVLGSVRALPAPVQCRGSQGLWTPPPEVVEAVEAQLGATP